MGRGRTRIDDERRSGSFSRRAKVGSLSVERGLCSFCGHHKVFSKNSGLFCTRCRRRVFL